MKILQLSQRKLKSSGISLHQSNQDYPFNTRNTIPLFVYSVFVVSSVVYFFDVAKKFDEYMTSVYFISTMLTNVALILIFISKMQKLFEFIMNFEGMIEKRKKHATSKSIYNKTNSYVEKLGEIIHFCMNILAICLLWPKFIQGIFVYFTTTLGSVALELPVPMWYPFDTQHPIGYSAAFCLQYMAAFYCFQYIACATSFGVGAILFSFSAIEDIKGTIFSIAKCVKSKKNSTQALKIFSTFAQLHSLFDDLCELSRNVILIVILWSLISLCCASLMIQMELNAGNTIGLVTQILNFCWSLGLLAFVCELCDRLTSAFGEIDYKIGRLKYYLLPVKIQRIIPIILMNVQKPVVFECFGNIYCDRMVFKKVVNCSFSYFMVLHKMGE